MNKFVAEFRQKGYFEYPIKANIQYKLDNLSKIWTAFYQQPMNMKEVHQFNDYSGGYEYKGPGSRDFKENFHVSLNYPMPKNSSSIDATLVYTSQDVIRSMIMVVKDIVNIMSEAVDLDIANIVCKDFESWVIRLLYYPPRSQGMDEEVITAASHIDKGITAHLFEDSPGLQVLWKKDGTQEKQWNDVISRAGFVHGYLGMLGQLYFKSMFPALCHRVVANNHTLIHGRKSGVLFSDFGEYRYDKETHGPTQGIYDNGQNYDEPHKEFEKKFILVDKKVIV